MSDHAEQTADRFRALGPVLKTAALAVFVAAIYALHKLSGQVTWPDVKTGISLQSRSSLALAIAFTGLSYLSMSFYDVLGTATAAPGKVPWRIAMVGGGAGCAVTNLLGFSWRTGGTCATARIPPMVSILSISPTSSPVSG